MKKLLLIALLFFAAATTKAQDDFDKIVYKEVEVEPAFPGGMLKWGKFLRDTINFEALYKNDPPVGKYKVELSFVIERDGSVTEVKVKTDPKECPDCTKEAIRVLKLSPKWTPGVQNGRNVRVSYTIPFSFTIPEKDDRE
ncbi:MAG: energy transducer TonB [Bacteroidota bacterium]